ncbi:hypothetical protein HCH_06943 [Hahella chejuensis KCTC 2396]|uniref:Uncharacterized protein n=1 Tax=Hahella chejuensis (strain KCTC 2396) TaxID=349521 RepID=Q2S714_HAHCH|nr:hypothetical protein HCH_06943 [Hahella chejuensis KCTC 2396]
MASKITSKFKSMLRISSLHIKINDVSNIKYKLDDINDCEQNASIAKNLRR